MAELQRIPNVMSEFTTNPRGQRTPAKPSYSTKCIRCGRTFGLMFNGGELDREYCCGLIYDLEHVQIDLVISEWGLQADSLLYQRGIQRVVDFLARTQE